MEAPWVRVLGSHDLFNKFTFYYSTQFFFYVVSQKPQLNAGANPEAYQRGPEKVQWLKKHFSTLST